MAEDKDSSRTKMIKDAPSESGVKDIIKKGISAVSSLADKLGFTQEKEYAGKTKEELSKKGGPEKKRAGGVVGSASKRADGCAVKGKTRGKMI